MTRPSALVVLLDWLGTHFTRLPLPIIYCQRKGGVVVSDDVRGLQCGCLAAATQNTAGMRALTQPCIRNCMIPLAV
jgi:hypothetical protein